MTVTAILCVLTVIVGALSVYRMAHGSYLGIALFTIMSVVIIISCIIEGRSFFKKK